MSWISTNGPQRDPMDFKRRHYRSRTGNFASMDGIGRRLLDAGEFLDALVGGVGAINVAPGVGVNLVGVLEGPAPGQEFTVQRMLMRGTWSVT